MSTVVVGCHLFGELLDLEKRQNLKHILQKRYINSKPGDANSPYALALALALFEKRGVVDIVPSVKWKIARRHRSLIGQDYWVASQAKSHCTTSPSKAKTDSETSMPLCRPVFL